MYQYTSIIHFDGQYNIHVHTITKLIIKLTSFFCSAAVLVLYEREMDVMSTMDQLLITDVITIINYNLFNKTVAHD